MSNILFRNRLLKESESFSPSSFFKLEEIPNKGYARDIDARIHDTLDRLNNIKLNSITIPISITENFLEFSGLRLGHHIRLTTNLSFNKTPIIFIGALDEVQLLKLSTLANILLTPNVFYVNLSISSFNSIEKMIEKLETVETDNFDFSKYLEKVNFKSPANYEDNHNISNEWSIYRWSQMIDDLCDDENINTIIERQKNNLYFKYLKTIHPSCNLSKFTSDELKVEHPNKRVLYIDDEVEKGWGEIFSTILGDINKLHFEYLDIEFNNLKQSEIINKSIDKVKKFNPDVVILDLRIHKDDFNFGKPTALSGYKILKEIKKINKGIQVIVFSATNKIWNLQALQEAGADGFIIKEGIENSLDSNFTRITILNFIRIIESLLKRNFLIDIYSFLTPLIKKIEANIIKKPKNYNLKISQGKLINYLDYLKSADLLLYSNPYNLNYCFLQLILVIEDIIKGFYIESSDKNQYVDISIYKKSLCLEKNVDQIKLMLKPKNGLNKFIEEDHIIYKSDNFYKLFNNQGDRIPFNYRLNSVLYFRYKIDLNQSSQYSNLYRLRSKSVAHIGGDKVKEKDILRSLELLGILIQ